ncbi:DUF494 family protein [Gallaecimonas xiamenensis]|uniref:Protein Smg n=1 Tax=Gallaecimonas xiamenensis 3-C-1 TaxID=745411 RepID=K2IDK4_9GAMM|nr:DUF494 family protein [Gallaecimonas xiamenensis]EKE68056.1 hypothetical protein B3C1_17652 [Gallaecimonas xiamenensis 3-C-1]
MFDVLMYLFENYVHSEVEVMMDHEQLTDELTRAGFRHEEIFKALAWLERLAALQENGEQPFLVNVPQQSIRIFTPEEMLRLDTQCRGFLLFLEQIQVLSGETREMTIDRLMDLEQQSISLEDLKWVVLMVLFNVPGQENAYAKMENLLFEEPGEHLH